MEAQHHDLDAAYDGAGVSVPVCEFDFAAVDLDDAAEAPMLQPKRRWSDEELDALAVFARVIGVLSHQTTDALTIGRRAKLIHWMASPSGRPSQRQLAEQMGISEARTRQLLRTVSAEIQPQLRLFMQAPTHSA